MRNRYAGRHVVLAGTGASAQNVLVGLRGLVAEHPATRVSWLVRRGGADHAFGGGDNDQLEARGALGRAAQAVVEDGARTGTLRSCPRSAPRPSRPPTRGCA